MPDIGENAVDKANVLRYNFRSLVAKEVHNKEQLCKLIKKDVPCKSKKLTSNGNVNANGVLHSSSSSKESESQAKPSATPHDFLKGDLIRSFFFRSLIRFHAENMHYFLSIGFSVYIKPDVHLDEMVPICARDQHLLYNIFDDKWKSAVILDAYAQVKGQTGFMPKWTSNGNSPAKSA